MADAIEFPDISFYQLTVNWNTMSSKTNNIIIRSSQGKYPDSRFKDNYPYARAYGMKRHIYHFCDDRYSPAEQADTIINLIRSDRPEGRVWFDWERTYDGKYRGLGNVVAIMQKVEAALPGISVGFYTAYYWFTDNSNAKDNEAEYIYLSNKPLWIAAYTATGSSAGLLIPSPWAYPPELHQWGTPPWGYIYGVSSQEIDMNRVLRNHQFYSEEPNMNQYRYEATAIGSGTRLRTDHNTAVAYVNSYNSGTLFEGDELWEAPTDLSNAGGVYQKKGDLWLRVAKANGAIPTNASGTVITYPVWVAIKNMGTNICTYVDNGPVAPPTGPIPPQEVIVKDKDGVSWRCTTFTQV